MNPEKITEATNLLLAARDAADAAEKAKREAEANFIATLENAGLTFVETADGKRVAVENRPRRKYDLSVFAEHLSADLLAIILKEEIDGKALDAAVKAYQIDPEIADKGTTVTYSTQVRVYGDAVREARS
jgi:hypothetical protein